jgi:2-iminobutanoate/2-iminopropanoate deaminase
MKTYGGEVHGPGGRVLPLSLATELDDLLLISGQLALREGKVEGDIAQQTGVIFDSLEAILAQAGLTLDNVVKTTIWLSDSRDFPAFNSTYAGRLRAPYPSRSCVVSALVIPGARVEIEAVASRRHRRV